MFTLAEFDRHELVVHAFDATSGLKAIVAVHSSVLGPAFGGCRMWPYADEAVALADALRLARAMTYKCAIAGVPHGGGKSVIIGDPRRDKTPMLLAAMGRLVDSLGGRYVIADDVGTTLADLAAMRRETRHTAAATERAMAALPVTAHGVLSAIQAAAEHVFGAGGVAGRTVAVQGLGNVGGPLCQLLHDAGAQLVVADLDPTRVSDAVRRFAARAVATEAIYDVAADIFAPCALGAILNPASIARMTFTVICGGANNQLASLADAATLAARGIVYVPDYLVGAGGVIDFHQEQIDDSPEAVLAAVARIGTITADILQQCASSDRTPLQVADAIVQARLARG